MTVRESLLAVSAYPIPMRTIEAISLKRGIALDDTVDYGILTAQNYRLALADLYVWLYFAPTVGQGGQSYSFSGEQRDWWKAQAIGIYEEYGAESELASLKGKYGYMGNKL